MWSRAEKQPFVSAHVWRVFTFRFVCAIQVVSMYYQTRQCTRWLTLRISCELRDSKIVTGAETCAYEQQPFLGTCTEKFSLVPLLRSTEASAHRKNLTRSTRNSTALPHRTQTNRAVEPKATQNHIQATFFWVFCMHETYRQSAVHRMRHMCELKNLRAFECHRTAFSPASCKSRDFISEYCNSREPRPIKGDSPRSLRLRQSKAQVSMVRVYWSSISKHLFK